MPRFPSIETEEAEQLKLLYSGMCPSAAKLIKVLWIGTHLALVQRKGTREFAGRGTTKYYLTWISLIDKESGGSAQRCKKHYIRHEMHEGRLTKEKWNDILQSAIASDDHWLEECEKSEIEERKKNEIEEAHRRYEDKVDDFKSQILSSIFNTTDDVTPLVEEFREFLKTHPDKKA